MKSLGTFGILLIISLVALISAPALASNTEAADEVTFHKDIQPIFQANCTSCHRPTECRSAG